MDLDAQQLPDSGEGVVCPMPCAVCDELGAGACEDCLDCLLWPEVVPPREATPIPDLPGRTSPTKSEELRSRRTTLDIGARVGLVSRRFRRTRGLSQRALAQTVGWSQPSVNRAEGDASPLSVGRVEAFLGHLGFRLAIVPVDLGVASALGEDPDEAWGAADLLVRDAAGRRPPAIAEVTWSSTIDRRLRAASVKHDNEWTWRRPAG